MSRKDQCMAGRQAFNDGNPTWRLPCERPTEHWHLVFTELPDVVIELCDYHYYDVERQGLITEPVPAAERLAVMEIIAKEQGFT